MRDLILLAALIGIIPMILRAPVVGLLAWLWIALMNPQREVYGFLMGFPLNFQVAALTGLAWMISKERKLVPLNPFTVFVVLFMLWASLATYLALDRAFSMPIWDRTIKTIALVLAIVMLANSKARIQAVIWIYVASLGYYAVKDGGHVLLTGGGQRVYGPENSMIADNNSLALALIVMLPLLNYLQATSRVPLARLACLATVGFAVLTIIGTYSRGALVALVAAGATYALRTRAALKFLAAGLVMAVALSSFLPASWSERMSTIQAYDEDVSFSGRVAAWTTSLNIATARPLTGGGFSAVERDPVARQFQSPGSLSAGRAAHSIYFQVLGDTGFVGLALYLLMVAAAGLNTFLVLAATRGRPELDWANLLARMLQVSLVAMLVGGAALSMAYYDGFLVLLAVTASLRQVVRGSAPQVAATVIAPWKRSTATLAAGASHSAEIKP
ncbi:putative O-glycosylation ligase, exosortase A-associated [Caulobacter sp. AP07]|uniref:putative O-glycosylation ligase, exosortase A system-associated n=1 Tax=Caulobacter sp. AP07 TaxID=1144304 RepID=UPI0002721B0C|nr:putative O-glycosylation ligase, exosortase A system-associated [Caulobacter sp. AP07]EJL33359.1 putative O-glycosylation ligase, exosortase A-associated [Caulobacter sp. AP07]